jgi:hypothetical protein
MADSEQLPEYFKKRVENVRFQKIFSSKTWTKKVENTPFL